jgi:hypothetical protein
LRKINFQFVEDFAQLITVDCFFLAHPSFLPLLKKGGLLNFTVYNMLCFVVLATSCQQKFNFMGNFVATVYSVINLEFLEVIKRCC